MRWSWSQKIGTGISLWLILMSQVSAQEKNADQIKPTETKNTQSDVSNKNEPIDSGVVLLNCRHVRPPYVVECRENAILINGLRFCSAMEGSGVDEANGNASAAHANRLFCNYLKRKLRENALLISWSGNSPAVFFAEEASEILEILTTADATDVKMDRLLENTASSRLSPQQWIQLAVNFQAISSIFRQEPFVGNDVIIEPEGSNEVLPPAYNDGRSWTYFATIGGMCLAVFGFGTLFRFRPQRTGRWRDLNVSDKEVWLVVYAVAFLIVLNLFDLVCTLSAGRSAGFWEINPLGHHLAAVPILLIGFKIAMTLLAATILFRLRHYFGAQIASWWLCVLCTVLTLRWAVFNSFFMV